ncbi:MAG: alkaline phosphatase family protein [Candidatus Nanosalina sp.]
MTVYVFGVDGASPELVEEYMADGDLPNFRELREESAYGDLETVFPPITPCAWTSFLTGKNPGKHGIYDFSVRKEQGEFDIVTSRDVGSDTVYDLMNRHGKKVGSLGIPLTYPPVEVDGYMVSGLPIDRIDRDKVYPEALWDDILDWGGLSIHASTFTGNNEEEYIKSHHEQIDQMEKVYFNLMDRYRDLDLNIVLFPNTDTMAHWMWKYIDEDHPDHPEDRNYEDCLRDVYIRMDEILGRLMERMDEDDHLIVMSDHGFGPVHKNIYLNNLFREKGLLEFKNRPITTFRRTLLKAGITPDRGYRLVSRLGLEEYVVQSEQKDEGGIIGKLASLPVLSEEDVDWENTEAFVRGNFGQIYLNDDLEGEERERVIEKVKDVLSEFEDPETGEKIIEKVERKEERYHGPETERAPDLLFFTKDLKYMSWRHFEFGSSKKIKSSPSRTGHHKMQGIFHVRGPGIEEGKELEGLKITDVVPTVLNLMDLPVPRDMDGEPILEAFKQDRNVEYEEKELEGLDF